MTAVDETQTRAVDFDAMLAQADELVALARGIGAGYRSCLGELVTHQELELAHERVQAGEALKTSTGLFKWFNQLPHAIQEAFLNAVLVSRMPKR